MKNQWQAKLVPMETNGPSLLTSATQQQWFHWRRCAKMSLQFAGRGEAECKTLLLLLSQAARPLRRMITPVQQRALILVPPTGEGVGTPFWHVSSEKKALVIRNLELDYKIIFLYVNKANLTNGNLRCAVNSTLAKKQCFMYETGYWGQNINWE